MEIRLTDFYETDGVPYNNIQIKKEIVDGCEFTIVSYIYNDNVTFNNPLLCEARGITFDSLGNIVSRPFEKFHNLNGHNTTQYRDLDFTGAVFYDKLDGSMIHPVLVNGKIYYKTKKSFYSEVAQHCQNDFGDNSKYSDFCDFCIDLGYTPIFEYTSPKNRVVLDYGDTPKLTLLALRHMDEGYYVLSKTLTGIAISWDIPYVQVYDSMTISDAILSIERDDVQNREGFVAVLRSGQRVKMKYPSYCLLHGTLDRINERDIAKMVISECIDDFKAMSIPRHQRIIEDIEFRVTRDYFNLGHDVCDLLQEWEGKPLAEIGKEYSSYKYFHPAIRAFKGSDLDQCIKEYFMNNIIPNYSTHNLW